MIPLVACVLPVSYFDSSVLELIIEEQVEKLQATLRGIETLSVVVRHTAAKLTELIGNDEVGTHELYSLIRPKCIPMHL